MNAKSKKPETEKNRPLTITVTPEQLEDLDRACELFKKAYGCRITRAGAAATCFDDGLKELLTKLS